MPLPFISPTQDGMSLALMPPDKRADVFKQMFDRLFAARKAAMILPGPQQDNTPLWGARIDMNDVTDTAAPGTARTVSDLYAD